MYEHGSPRIGDGLPSSPAGGESRQDRSCGGPLLGPTWENKLIGPGRKLGTLRDQLEWSCSSRGIRSTVSDPRQSPPLSAERAARTLRRTPASLSLSLTSCPTQIAHTMPVIEKGSLVLISGPSGYLGARESLPSGALPPQGPLTQFGSPPWPNSR